MAGRTRIQPLDRSFELSLREELSAEGRSRQLADFAREEIAKASQINREISGSDVPLTVFVDGREGAPLESVAPDGTIVARFELVEDVLSWIGRSLIQASPVRSGRYRDSHILLADGVEIDADGSVPDAAVYVFVNTQPYARKIEGDMARPPQSPMAAEGVYEAVAAMANQRFGNIARVTSGWQALSSIASSDLEAWASKTTMRRADRDQSGARQAEWLRRQPSIFVRRF